MNFRNIVFLLDALSFLRSLPDESIDMCVTSPPYWQQRNYEDHPQQIGLEATPEEYVNVMVMIFREVRRVLKLHGTLWLNLGDTYAANGGGQVEQTLREFEGEEDEEEINGGVNFGQTRKPPPGYKPKDIIGIPWMVAFALREDGWYLRGDNIWHKPSSMPSSVEDRCPGCWEDVFLLAKNGSNPILWRAKDTRQWVWECPDLTEKILNARGKMVNRWSGFDYYFDRFAIEEKATGYDGRKQTKMNGSAKYQAANNAVGGVHGYAKGGNERWRQNDKGEFVRARRNLWAIPAEPLDENHFAAFPQELAAVCIKAGCPAGGIVLDPFMGSGRTAIAAAKIGVGFTGSEINQASIDIMHRQLKKELGMFAGAESAVPDPLNLDIAQKKMF